MKRNWLHILTIFLLIFSLLAPGLTMPAQSSAATPTDVTGHWAYTYIARGIELGFISGYPDGTFLPDKAVSRAEFAKMMNAALGNTNTASISFKDVPISEWFYNDVSKAVAATYVAGYGDGAFSPNTAISRQEAAVMIARIVPSYGIYANLNVYSDGSKTAEWATEYMKKIVGKTYLGAYDDGLLHPGDSLTRAQTAKIICSILDKETIVKTPTTIKADATIIKNTIYTNELTISKDLAEGNATFQNCTFMGGLLVSGGGKASIVLENSRVTQLNVNKAGSAVHVLAKGETTISETTTREICSLETASLGGGVFGKGFLSVDITRNGDTTLIGSFPSANLAGSNGIVRLEKCSLDKLVVSGDAKGSNIHVDSRSSIATTDVNAVAAFHGTGTIKQMNANVSGITYETKPTNWTLASGVIAPTETSPTLTAVFEPADSSKAIALAVKPTITFSTEVETMSGASITDTYLKNNLVFKKGSSSGTDVAFTASLSPSKKVITISPDKKLDSNQIYYLGFAKDKYRAISSKEALPAKNISFTTLNTTPTVTISPVNNSTQVATNASIIITFSEPVYNNTGAALIVSYLNANITVTKNSDSSSPATAATSISGNVVTIKAPTAGWGNGESYTVNVLGSAFRNSALEYVGATSSSFVAGTAAPVLTMTAPSPSLSYNSVLVTARSTIPGQGYFVAIETTTGAFIPSSKTEIISASGGHSQNNIGLTSSNFTITGLTPNTPYIVYGVVNGNSQDSLLVSQSFVTSNLPSTDLTYLEYSYLPSGSAIRTTAAATVGPAMTGTIPADATDIKVYATAASSVLITFSDGASGSGTGSATSSTVTMASTPIVVTITTSIGSYGSNIYTFTLSN